ncbi:MAG: hypothetical protein ACK5JH_11675 [Anaerocolumna sp.]
MKYIKILLRGLWCVLGGYYLTWCVDKVTLDTFFHRLFVYIYFTIILVFFSAFLGRVIKKYVNSRFGILKVTLSIITTLMIFIPGFDIFVGESSPIKILITAMGQMGVTHNEQQGTEVWITSISLDGKKYSLKDIPIVSEWELRDGYLLSYQNQPSTLEIELPRADNIEISFISHPWSGEVEVEVEGSTDIYSLDLYQFEEQGGSEKKIEFTTVQDKVNFSNSEKLAIVSCLIFIFGMICILLCLYRIKYIQSFVIFLYLLFLLLILPIEIDRITFVILNGLNIILSLFLPDIFVSEIMKKYISPKNIILLLLINIYAAFALVAQSLFLSGDKVSFDIISFCKFLFYVILFFLINIYIIFLLESVYIFLGTKLEYPILRNNNHTKNHALFYLIFFIPWIIALIGFFPVNMTSDSVDQWRQAQGIIELTNHHPAFHTLMIRWISYLYPSPFVVGLVQVVFCAYVLSDLWVYLIGKNINRNILMIFALVVALSPGNIMLVTTLWKDIPYTFSLLWLGGLLLRVFDDIDLFFKKPLRVICLIVSLVLVFEFRHNGVIPFLFVILTLVVLAVSKLSRNIVLTLKIMICAVLPVLCVAFINGPLFSYYHVNTEAVGGTKYTPMLTALGSIAHNDLKLEDKSIELMESTNVTLEEYSQYYSRFNGDNYIYGIPNKTWDRSSLGMSEVMTVYLDELVKYPDVIIKDRLDGTELLWNVSQAQGSFNYKYDIGVYSFDGANMINTNFIAKFLGYYCEVFNRVSILNILFWRSGIYIILLFVLLLFVHIKKLYKSMIFLIPCFGNFISLILSMYHQSYRYIYFIPISVLIFTLIVLANTKEKEERVSE